MTTGTRDWIVRVETMPGFTAWADVLESVADAIEGDERARGPALSHDRSSGVLSASFTVDARAAGAAMHTAIDVFYDGLAAAGFDVDRPGWRLAIECDVAEAA